MWSIVTLPELNRKAKTEFIYVVLNLRLAQPYNPMGVGEYKCDGYFSIIVDGKNDPNNCLWVDDTVFCQENWELVISEV